MRTSYRLPRTLASVLLVTSVGLAATACGGDGSDGGSSKTEDTSEVGSPATLDTTSTTAAPADTTPATTTTLTPAGPVGAPTPETATEALYDAFVAGDRNAAALVAEPEAIDIVFAATPGPYQPYRGCDTAEFDTSGCLYRDRSTNNTIQFDMERRGETWVVTGAFFSPG